MNVTLKKISEDATNSAEAAANRVQDCHRNIIERLRRFAKEGVLYPKAQRKADDDALKKAEDDFRLAIEQVDKVTLALPVDLDSSIATISQHAELSPIASHLLSWLVKQSPELLEGKESFLPTDEALRALGTWNKLVGRSDLCTEKPTLQGLKTVFDELNTLITLKSPEHGSIISFPIFSQFYLSADSTVVGCTLSGQFLFELRRLRSTP